MNLNTNLLNSNFSLHENACRTCLKLLRRKCGKKCIFQQNIKSKIEDLTAVILCEEDGVPNLICDACSEKLNCAVEFKRQVETVNEFLKQHLNASTTETRYPKTEQALPEILNDLKNQTIGEEKSLGVNTKKINDNNESDASLSAHEYELASQSLNNSLNRETTIEKKRKNSVTCPTCNKNLKTATSLKAHLRTHGVVERKLECNNCGKKYTNQYDLRVHLRKYTGVRPFSCKVCQKTFADRRCFEKHKKIHSGEKLFKCEICDKSFIHSYTLKTHQRVHSGEKPFICAKCGHSFTTTTQLKLHTRIHHTREKPYGCNLCPKVFASSSGLSNHKMTHTGERKFICSICGKGSRTSSDLKCHLRTHTGERPFKCTFPDCDKKYKTNSQLCTHIRTHTGEKNKKCKVCYKKFSNMQFKSHLCTY